MIAILCATTVYSFSPLLLNALLLAPAGIIYFLAPQQNRAQHKKAKPPASARSSKDHNAKEVGSVDANKESELFPERPFLTAYRGAMMIATCISILAVDFPIFPRRFAKVENWGTSLMDLGVGSFVFSGGVVSARAIARSQLLKSPKDPFVKRLISSVRHSIPLLVLGLIRLYSVKGLDYAEHVTEYGVHWNFFFTLGFMAPFVEIVHALTAIIPSYGLLSAIIAVSYQVLLDSTDLTRYILVSPRGPSLLSKNREGVFSFLGYLAIFLAGRATGLRVIPRDSRASHLYTLATTSAVWSVAFAFLSTYLYGIGAGIPVSRRLANLPYVVWIVAFNNCQLFVFRLIERVCFPTVYRGADRASEKERGEFATSRIMRAFNKNGLAIFLIANLLTGAVNMGMNTLDANKYVAMSVLIGYASVITALALALDYWNLKLKL